MNELEDSGKRRLFAQKNETARMETYEEIDETTRLPLLNFCRRLDAPQIYWERVLPTLERKDAHAIAAVRDRPWPPWGLGAQKIDAVCIVHPVGADSVAVSPVYVTDEDVTNVGLIAAVYNEALQTLDTTYGEGATVSYLVIEGSILADRVLTASGFQRTDDLFLTEEARYNIYSADARQLRKHLGLVDVSIGDLLAHDVDPETLERNALFHWTIHLATRGGLLDKVRRPEMIPIDGGLFDASLPGGVPPGPPS